MEILTRTVWTLLLGHLLTDFVFQTNALLQQKKSGRACRLCEAWGDLFCVRGGVDGIFCADELRIRGDLRRVALGLTLVHLAIDGMQDTVGAANSAGGRNGGVRGGSGNAFFDDRGGSVLDRATWSPPGFCCMA